MLNVSSDVTVDKNPSSAYRRGVRNIMADAADVGFGVSQERVPRGADSFLASSGYEPEEQPDGSWEWGYSAGYAAAVEDGSVPHWIPVRAMPDMERWARRVLGDENAAWAVRHKIAKEGTDAQEFVEPGKNAQKAHLRAKGVKASVEREL